MRNPLLPLLACLSLSVPAWAEASCPPEGTDLKSLQLLKEQDFALAEDDTRNRLAMGLLACLGDRDPELRDGIAYEAITMWLRSNQLDMMLVRRMREQLYAMLDEEDEEGFRRPFAALMLSEVARTDRIQPWMSPAERDAMVGRATRYLRSVRDYRGFDDADGWRHGVAHGADWLLQLTSNPALDRRQVQDILDAVAEQVVPEAPHAYVFGEPGRLVRPVVFAARGGLLSEADWQAWFGALPDRLGDESLAYRDNGWLARRHDLLAFLTSMYLEADQSTDARVAALKPAVVTALRKIP